jgi:RNA polymerase primary sigma factor
VKNITTNKNILSENSDILQKYFKDISKCKRYSSEEQIELARKMRNGDLDAREKLINSNLLFVITCAKQYVGQGVPLLDLIQAGAKGLIESLTNYDPDKGYHFISFAVWYIRREIIKAIYNTGRTIRYPITYISKITKVKKAYDKFLDENGREPTDDELIKLTNYTQKQYDSVIMNKSYCSSLDTPVSDDERVLLSDTIAEEPTTFIDNFTKDTISNSLKVLNPREYKVITEFYGVDGAVEKPIKDIALEMGLGSERVRQIRKGAIKKLKARCGNTLKTLL